MNLEARKTEFVQEFLKLQSKEAILQLEMILRKEQKNSALPILSGVLNQQNVTVTPEPPSRKLSGYPQVSDKSLQKIKGRLRDFNKINFVKK
jgi:hypothetical protein